MRGGCVRPGPTGRPEREAVAIQHSGSLGRGKSFRFLRMAAGVFRVVGWVVAALTVLAAGRVLLGFWVTGDVPWGQRVAGVLGVTLFGGSLSFFLFVLGDLTRLFLAIEENTRHNR